MPTVGYNTVFPKRRNTKFVVKNITKGTRLEKIVRLFKYPVPPGQTRDLLTIPYVSESDIRHSLLKGELRLKAEAREIEIVESNIDLLQFDSEQKAFLESIGISIGLEVVASTETALKIKQNVELVGAKDGVNVVFTVPVPDKFINGPISGSDFRILIRHNGKGLIQNIDYVISESGGFGTGYDTITLISFVPNSNSTLVADYVIAV